MLENEAAREQIGAPIRDISQYSDWRDDAPDQVVSTINLYASYLIGQTNGMSDALSLPAVCKAFEIEGIPKDEWPNLTQDLLLVHRETMTLTEKRQKMRKGNG